MSEKRKWIGYRPEDISKRLLKGLRGNAIEVKCRNCGKPMLVSVARKSKVATCNRCPPLKTKSFGLPVSLIEKLETRAKKKGVSQSILVENILKSFLEGENNGS